MALPHIGSSREPNAYMGLDLMSNQDGESRELSSIVLQISKNSTVSLESSDKYRSLSYSPTSGIYKISFLNPASNATEVDRLTIESTVL